MPKSKKDRVPMMGQGFSRMLQTVSPEMTLSAKNSNPKNTTFAIKDEPSTVTQSIRRNSGSIPLIDPNNTSEDEKLPDISNTK